MTVLVVLRRGILRRMTNLSSGPMRLAMTLCALVVLATHALAQWKPAELRLQTPWSAEVSPTSVHPEHPRPLLFRPDWSTLNGLWEYAVTAPDAPAITSSDDRILVPFPPESALSGVGRTLQPNESSQYLRRFRIQDNWRGKRILLHFGAVDWRCKVWVNGTEFPEHIGGYTPFTHDITQAVRFGEENILLVRATDPTDTGGQPRGKQWLKPHGIWYTPTSGIWQTVWLEAVPDSGHIEAVTITPNWSKGQVTVLAQCAWPSAGKPPIQVDVLSGNQVVASGASDTHQITLDIPSPRAWTPDDPFLYHVLVRFKDRGPVDEVRSYFGLREIRVGKDDAGAPRLLLNGRPLFQFGPLDQGFWPDGLYTAPTDAALRFDVEAVKAMGGNMLRKHVKVEPELFYNWCDRLGVLVWQDIPSPFFHSEGDNPHANPPPTPEWKANFEREMRDIIGARGGHPSIVMWVPFNEGWGQSDMDWAKSMVDLAAKLDPTRLVNNASGWTDMGNGDVIDIHVYPGPGSPAIEPERAAVLGEFGGLGLPLDGHTWLAKNNWGYVSYPNQEKLTEAYIGLIDRLPLLIARGLCAAVYTQTSDVEIEVNGWLTYDRKVWKINPELAKAAAFKLYEPPPVIDVIVPAADTSRGQPWRYTFQDPGQGWEKSPWDEDDPPRAPWAEGGAGFGSRGTPGAIISTEWTTPRIWLRRSFTLQSAIPEHPALLIHHDEDAIVYINGVQVASLSGYTTSYTLVALGKEGRQALRPGRNTLSIVCSQTRGGQYIDCGLVDVKPGR